MGLRVLYDYRIADNQRDLYCEISYHAATSPEWRNRPDIQEKIMEHIERELEDKSRTSGWWATYAAYYPLSYWIRRVEKKIAEATCTVSGAVSGVFALAQ